MAEKYVININMVFSTEQLRNDWVSELVAAYQTIKLTNTKPDSGTLSKTDRYDPVTVSQGLN